MTFTSPIGQPSERSTSRDVLQAVLDTVREGVLIVDASTRIAAANAAATSAFGWQDGVLVGKRLSEIIRDPTLHRAFHSAANSGSAHDIRIDITDRGKRTFDVRVAPIEIDGKSFATGVFYDVTQIEKLEKVRQEFLSNISHELRTPLTAIMAFVETLEDGAIDDAENNRRFLGVIRRNAGRMHALIADILELSLIESGNVSVEMRWVELSPLVNEVFASISSIAAQRSVKLSYSAESDVRVYADPVRLEQMLTNLIDNAVKFNREKGEVVVRHERRGGRDVISVSDTGEGISADHLERVFERFYRADRGRTREVGGTGLGLAIVKHLARLQGGEISATSELGRGTTFSIEMPAK